MASDNSYLDRYDEEEEESSFSLGQLWSILVLNWYWIVLSVIICLIGAKLYLRYTNPVYSASMKILIKDDGNGSKSKMSATGVISTSSGFDNELQILTSSSIATRVVKSLHLYVTYIHEGHVRDVDLYKTSPILADMLPQDIDNLNSAIYMTVERIHGGIHVDGGGSVHFSQDIKNLPATINTPAGVIMLQANPGYQMDGRPLHITIAPPASVARSYAGRVSAVGVKGTSVAQVTMVETDTQRAKDYLNNLLESYNIDANEDKNESARKTEEFIKNRINEIRSELDSTEINLEEYKRNNKLINLANNATAAFGKSSDYQDQQVAMQTQVMLLQSMIDYFNNPENADQVIPSNLGLADAGINADVATYNEKVVLRNRLLKGSSEANPAVIKLNDELETLWSTIKASLRNAHKVYALQSRSINNQYDLFNGQVSNTPAQERALTNIGRQQDIKANLYMMLLQKNEENYISLASTANKARMVDAPVEGGKISPNDRNIQLGALGIGLVLPIAILFLLQFMRYRIEGREDVERLSKLPIIADIPLNHELKNKEHRAVVVCENSNSMMEETFRGLRSNLRFIINGEEKVILCTSAIPGEGKTFVATNLAMSLALLGKHVLVMGLDIRKPQLVKLFGLNKDKRGITSYLANDHADFDLLEEQISHSVLNANLDVIPAGIIPPNPAELLSSQLLTDALNYLRKEYDYIILDTPPVGLVSDTLDVGHVADMTLFICRADFSAKANFSLINDIARDGKLPKVNLVLNGVDLRKRKYGYYYGYGKYGKYGYSKYGKYGRYAHYGHYGHYGLYGTYGNDTKDHAE